MFNFEPAPFVPYKNKEVLEICRNIKREDMEYTNENGYSVRIVIDPTLLLVQDIFHLYLAVVGARLKNTNEHI